MWGMHMAAAAMVVLRRKARLPLILSHTWSKGAQVRQPGADVLHRVVDEDSGVPLHLAPAGQRAQRHWGGPLGRRRRQRAAAWQRPLILGSVHP